jgi:hypothetical protein
MQDQTKFFINFMTVFISQVPDPQHRQQLEYALARTQALMAQDTDTIERLLPPHIPKPLG